jgi:hypothetical protein
MKVFSRLINLNSARAIVFPPIPTRYSGACGRSGELLREMKEAGEREGPRDDAMSNGTTFPELGVTRDPEEEAGGADRCA